MKKYVIICFAAMLGILTACNDEFLEKKPIVLQTEAAFVNYQNFLTYNWRFYNIFLSADFVQTLAQNARDFNGAGDILACWLTSAMDDDQDVSRRDRSITVPSTGGGWTFSDIRMVNIMDRNIDGSQMSPEDKAHWRSVCYFFFCYKYMELISRFGDVPWVNHVLKDDGSDDDIIYGPQQPRKVVADSVLKRLQWAEKHIKVNGDGPNTINKACVLTLISRFGLFEGTWRKYHNLGDYAEYLSESARASEALMAMYPTISDNFDELVVFPETGGKSLIDRPGIILCMKYETATDLGTFAGREERAVNTRLAMHRATADMYLVKSNGLPLTNPANAARPDIDMYDEFRDRDPRLLMTVCPPYSQRVRVNYSTTATFPFPDFTPASYNHTYERTGLDNQEFVKLLPTILTNPSSKRLPVFQQLGSQMIWSIPNFPTSPVAQFRSKPGYICWKNYALWDAVVSVNGNNMSDADKPIFFIEEILLNYAEAKWELGQFDQTIADKTINRLRKRTTVKMPEMKVAEIDATFDPSNPADKVTPGRDITVDPVLWEIRRERMVELMGLGFGFSDIRRWKKGPWFYDRPIIGAKMDKQYYKTINAQGVTQTTTPAWVNNLPIVNKDFSPIAAGQTSGYIKRFDDMSKEDKGWDDAFYLFPIPKDELNLNPNLKQNPGWDKY